MFWCLILSKSVDFIIILIKYDQLSMTKSIPVEVCIYSKE